MCWLTPYFLHFATHALCNMCTLQLVHFATYALCNLCTLPHMHFATNALCKSDQVDRPVGRTSWTDQFFLFEALARSHFWRLTFQFVHCHSFPVRRRPRLASLIWGGDLFFSISVLMIVLFWMHLKIPQNHRLKNKGMLKRDVGKVSVGCLRCVLRISEVCLEVSWRASGWHLKGF